MSSSVSIIIPNYNKVRFLGEPLDSIINQTSDNWEAIVVDDGSSDTSKDILEDYHRKEERIQVHYLEGGNGGSYCRNFGLSKSHCQFIIFLDADDLLEPSCIENRLKIFQENPSRDFIVFSMGTFREKIGDSKYVWLLNVDYPLQKFLRHELPWQTMQPIWKKDFVQSIDGFNPEYERMQDVEFHTRALLITKGKRYWIK